MAHGTAHYPLKKFPDTLLHIVHILQSSKIQKNYLMQPTFTCIVCKFKNVKHIF